ncbi:CoA-transferase [Desulfatitalea tepidiphila]|uniref:CoA-transferase n=1 Tax=Desulfatitalea tepidiphila TaxID=1185843 RepID=UPI0006B4EDED|nr:CoA-transferase [Desulfatitalea tepidiphila]
MKDRIRTIIEEKMSIPVVEGEDKRCTPKEAVEKHIEKHMTLNFSAGVGALVYELVRSFWDKAPEFTVISPSLNLHLVAIVRQRIAKKILTSFAGINYPSPRPCPVVQNAYASGVIDIESWTMRTIPQRLLAGAMGMDFVPTRSLIGSTMAEENRESFQVVENPFGRDGRIGLLRALQPDITLVHGAVADRSGNTILTYPLAGDAYGAWAAKKGVIVSVDKIVSTAYIRRHAHMVRIPAYSVLAVCEAPFGAHPVGVMQHGLPDFDAYFPDYDFMIDVNNATKNEGDFDRWVQEWILDVRDHDDYLSRLGSERILYLKGKAAPDAWLPETMTEAAGVDFSRPPNALERMVVAAGHIIAERCETKGFKNILAGIGLSNLSAWLAAYALKGGPHEVDLMAEIGMYGYLPRTSDPAVFSLHNMHACKMLSNIETVLGFNVGGSTNRCLGVLGAGMIDPHGNANSTKISDKVYLVGSGGSNDIATTNQETLVVMNAGRHRLVEKLPYITYPGGNVRTVVTDVGMFEKLDGSDRLTLTAYLPEKASDTEAQCVEKARAEVGWQLAVAPSLRRLPLSDVQDLTMLRLFDPRGYYIGR